MSIARRSPARSSVVRCSVTSGGTRFGPFRSPSGVLSPFLVGAPPGSPGLRRFAAGRDLRRGCVSRRSLPAWRVSLRWRASSASGRRLRWRLRGAWLWPAFLALTVVDAVLIVAAPAVGGAPACSGRAARRLRQPARGRRARAAARGWGCAAAGPTCRARSRQLRGHRAARAITCCWSRRLLHRPALGRAGGRRGRRWSRPCARTSRRTRPSIAAPGSATIDARASRPTCTAPACRGTTRARAVPDRGHRPAPGAGDARHRGSAEQLVSAVRRLRLAEVASLHDDLEAVEAGHAAVAGDLDRRRVRAVVSVKRMKTLLASRIVSVLMATRERAGSRFRKPCRAPCVTRSCPDLRPGSRGHMSGFRSVRIR